MARRFFRKLVPSDQKLQKNSALRALQWAFGRFLLNKQLWHLNRHSTAWGVASGLFWAWIGLPIQTIGAVTTAILGRGNVPLAMAFTWVSNPLTWIPCFYLAYRVGLLVTPAEPIKDFRQRISQIMDAGPIDGLWKTGEFMTENLARLYPMLVGGVILGLISAVLSFVTVKLLWRWMLIRRWNRRHHERRSRGFPVKFTSGFAHLHRAARVDGR